MNGRQLNRILILDDEIFIRTTIKGVLRTIGRFDIEDAVDGETALALLPGFRSNLVLCDVGVRPMSGFEFTERLRSQKDEAQPEVWIINTGRGCSREHGVRCPAIEAERLSREAGVTKTAQRAAGQQFRSAPDKRAALKSSFHNDPGLHGRSAWLLRL